MTREEAIERTEVIFAGTNSEVLQALNQPITLAEFLGWEEGEEYEIIEENERRHFKVSDNKLYIKFPGDTDKGWYLAGTLINEFKGLLGATHVKPETPLNRLVKKASEIVGKNIHSYKTSEGRCELRDDCEDRYLALYMDYFMFINTTWAGFNRLNNSKRKQLIEAVIEYYEEVKNE